MRVDIVRLEVLSSLRMRTNYIKEVWSAEAHYYLRVTFHAAVLDTQSTLQSSSLHMDAGRYEEVKTNLAAAKTTKNDEQVSSYSKYMQEQYS
jgi:hypothetical protein